jgi:hypothetical protein
MSCDILQLLSCTQIISIADLHHIKADPDPALHFNADPDPVFHYNAGPDPDPAPHESDEICDQWSTDPQGLHFDSPGLYCECSRPSAALF